MASLWKHPQSKFWFACFTARDGRQLKRSTKETNRTKAMKIALEYEAAAKRTRTALQVRAVIQDLQREIMGEELQNLTVRQFFANWVEEKRPSSSAATLRRYSEASQRFVMFLGAKAEGEVAQIRRQDVRDFHNEELKRVSASTANGELKCLRMGFKTARRDALIVEDPSEFVMRAKEEESDGLDRQPLTIAQVKLVLARANEEWRSIIILALYTGQRLSDIATMRWNNVDLVNRRIKLVTRKTGKKLTIPIAKPLQEHLETIQGLTGHDAPIHPNAFDVVKRQKGRVGTLSNQFAAILASAGLRPKVSKRSKGKGRGGKREKIPISFHSLRHTAVTLLKEAGIPAAVVMELVGHDSEQMSHHYTHVGDDALETAVAAMPDVLDGVVKASGTQGGDQSDHMCGAGQSTLR